MSLRIVCPGCRAVYTVADELRGKKARCRECQTLFPIDAPAAAPAACVVCGGRLALWWASREAPSEGKGPVAAKGPAAQEKFAPWMNPNPDEGNDKDQPADDDQANAKPPEPVLDPPLADPVRDA